MKAVQGTNFSSGVHFLNSRKQIAVVGSSFRNDCTTHFAVSLWPSSFFPFSPVASWNQTSDSHCVRTKDLFSSSARWNTAISLVCHWLGRLTWCSKFFSAIIHLAVFPPPKGKNTFIVGQKRDTCFWDHRVDFCRGLRHSCQVLNSSCRRGRADFFFLSFFLEAYHFIPFI